MKFYVNSMNVLAFWREIFGNHSVLVALAIALFITLGK